MSAILETSIMEARESAGHSRKVKRRRLDVTTVRGPVGEARECLVYRFMRDLMRVVLPTWCTLETADGTIERRSLLVGQPQRRQLAVLPLEGGRPAEHAIVFP